MNGFNIVYIVILSAMLLGIAGFSVYTVIRLMRQSNSYKHHHKRRK